jgi:hypothetical protein
MAKVSELARLLAGMKDIAFTLTHVALHDGTTGEGWAHDAWRYSITRNGVTASGPYRTGIGHRVPRPGVKRYGVNHVDHGSLGRKTDIDAACADWTKPVKPPIADVVGALLSDASGVTETFDDWCAEFGHDTDSRRALETYLTCQRTRSQLLKLFGREFDALSQAEH